MSWSKHKRSRLSVGEYSLWHSLSPHTHTIYIYIYIYECIGRITQMGGLSPKSNFLHHIPHINSNCGNKSRVDRVETVLHTLCRMNALFLTDESFAHYAPVLWNTLPIDIFTQPSPHQSFVTLTDSPILLALSFLKFHSELETFLIHQSFPP